MDNHNEKQGFFSGLQLSDTENSALVRFAQLNGSDLFERMARDFNGWLRSMPETAEFFGHTDPAGLAQFHDRLSSHFQKILSAPYGAARRNDLNQLGALHHHAGVPGEWLTGAYATISEMLQNLASTTPGLSPVEKTVLHKALHKRIELDRFWQVEGFQQASGALLLTRSQFLEATTEIARILRDAPDGEIQSTLQSVTERLVHTLDMAAVWIGRLSSEEDWVQVVAAAGPARDFAENMRVYKDLSRAEGRGTTGQALHSGHAVITDLMDAENAFWRDKADSARVGGAMAASACPHSQEQVTLTVYRHAGMAFPQDHLGDILMGLVKDIAVYLDRQDISYQLKRLQRFQELQRSIQQFLLQQPDPPTLYQALADHLAALPEVEGVDVLTPTPDGTALQRYYAAGDLAESLAQLPEPSISDQEGLAVTIPAQVWQTGERIIRFHRAQDPDAPGIWRNRPLLEVNIVGGWPLRIREDQSPIAVLMLFARNVNSLSPDVVHTIDDIVQSTGEALRHYQDHKRVEEMALYDGLTGLPNRAYFLESGAEALARSLRNREHLAVGLLDLDGFKDVNDILGHEMGDRLLQSIAQRLQETRRGGDVVARMGGDEFAFHSPISGPDDLAAISLRFLSAVTGAASVVIDMPVSCSIGWAIAPIDGNRFEELYAHADIAMYAAKAAGKSTYRLYSGAVSRHAERKIYIHRNFPVAISRGDVQFFLQPQADILDRRIDGVELLVRWRRPDGGWSFPKDFMSDVEDDTDLIRGLGILGLQEADRLRVRLRSLGLDWNVSINIGARHFLHPDFLDDVMEHCPDGNGIVLEITETTTLGSLQAAEKIAWQLKDRRFRLSMDDFGTGFSSLLSTANLPFDELKLDQSFIRSFRHNESSFAVVGSARLLGDLSGRSLIAEGISDPGDLALWLRMGGRRIQGYYLAPPLPESALLSVHQWLYPDIFSDQEVCPLEDFPLLLHIAVDYGTIQKMALYPVEDCPVGIWFKKNQRKYGDLPGFFKGMEVHRQFHDQSIQRTKPEQKTIAERMRAVSMQICYEISSKNSAP